MAIGDLNRDQRQDLAVANGGSNTVSVLLDNGDGTFGPGTEFPAGFDPRCVAIGDLDGDQRLDLAVANYGSNTVSVLLGNGDGSFEQKIDFGADHQPQWVATGDLGYGGRVDLAVANPTSNIILVLENNGVPTDVSGTGPGPRVHLAQSWPNPALGGGVAIGFALARPQHVSLRLYDAAGRFVATLAEGALAAGPYTVRWDQRTRSGAEAAAGVYFYELRTPGARLARRLTVVR